MELDVRVVVLPDVEKSTDGTVKTDVPMEQLRADIVEELSLGSPADWDLAVIPVSLTTSLSRYKPAKGDTLVLIKKTEAQTKSFRPR